MKKAEKIKAEIERRLRTIEPNLPSREEFDKVADRNPGINSDFNIGEKMGAYTMLKKVEQFIDSLEQPIKRTPADIEAAMQEVEEKSKLFTEAHKDDVVSNDPISNPLEISRHRDSHIGETLEEAAKNYEEDAIFYAARRISDFFKAGAQWKKANLWKDAQGNDLPEIDREVIVLVKSLPEYEDSLLKVAIAHRPPEYWIGKSIGTGEITRYEPKRYDKGGWNQPSVVWWLDVDFPK